MPTDDENPRLDAPNLEFVSSDDLWDELAKRYDGAVLICDCIPKEGEAEQGLYYHGSISHCLGLVEYGLLRFRERVRCWSRALERSDDEEPGEGHPE